MKEFSDVQLTAIAEEAETIIKKFEDSSNSVEKFLSATYSELTTKYNTTIADSIYSIVNEALTSVEEVDAI